MMEKRKNQRKISFYYLEGNQLAENLFDYDRKNYFHNGYHRVRQIYSKLF